jgi:HEAT repeat protein
MVTNGLEIQQRILDAFYRGLQDPTPEVRARSVQSIGNLGLQGAIPRLISIFYQEQDITVIGATITALGALRCEDSVTTLAHFLHHEQDWIREMTVNALGQIGNEEAIMYLGKSLSDLSPHIRAMSAKSLGHIGSELGIPYLEKALNDTDPYVRLSAIESFFQIALRLGDTQVIPLAGSNPE